MKQSVLQMDKHEVFELTEALYVFAILNHSGMSSDLYSLQCEISNHYNAGMGFSESEVEENNIFYHEITEHNARDIWNRVEYYLENRWNDE
tara:strand:- start:26137 stop:26409 length:273 start_codon:yes stop_codon:yes gene_type:complete